RYPESAELDELFYAQQISGASRLPNGNTLICNGPAGYGFEVTPDEEIVWDYVNPVTAFGATTQGNDAGNNAVFRLPRYAIDYPGFIGRDMTPGDVIELGNWIDNCTSDISIVEVTEIVAYPNPFTDVVWLRFEDKGEWFIHTLDGKLIEKGSSEKGDILEIGAYLTEGCYILRFENEFKTAITTLLKI
ncbi:MAG: T9SS type A sorting domain-containing protein, partial [Bacteroidetes bacterium]|nr:T9SS type A sorting domain-containing protein [Bacteroidota bacterium]